MISVTKNSWNKISVEDYRLIRNILQDDSVSQITKNVQILSVLTETSVEDLLKENMQKVQELFKQLEFLQSFPEPRKLSMKTLKIKDHKYKLITNIDKYNVSQLLDFQAYIANDPNEHYAEILSTIIIPEGKQYNEDYDINEVINDIKYNLSIDIAHSLVFFYTEKLMKSLKGTKTYLDLMTKMLTPRKKTVMKQNLGSKILSLIGLR